MAEVVGLYDYPVTGAQERPLEDGWISAAGFILDRALVLYDASAPAGKRNRISRKEQQLPALARLHAMPARDGSSIRIFDDGRKPLEVGFDETSAADCTVVEFDDPTPAIDCGDEAAGWFSDAFPQLSEKGDVRLAQKTSEWLLGYGTEPSSRSVAALHLVTLQSIRHAQETQGNASAEYDRYRPNIVIDAPEYELGHEAQWQEFMIGEVPFYFHKETKRCEITKQHPKTGENLDDLKITGFPRKNMFGIYCYPLLEPGSLANISVGDTLHVA